MGDRPPHPGCAKHDRSNWTRIKAPSVRLLGGGPGIWGCNVCHPVPEPLLPEVEFFDEAVHGPEFDGALEAWRAGQDPSATTHVVGRPKPSTINRVRTPHDDVVDAWWGGWMVEGGCGCGEKPGAALRRQQRRVQKEKQQRRKNFFRAALRHHEKRQRRQKAEV